MAKSKFDYSLLKPLPEEKSSFESQLRPLDEEMSFAEEPQEESFLKRLPIDIVSGAAHAGRNLANLPHDLAELIEGGAQKFGSLFSSLPGSESTMRPHRSISSLLPNDTTNYAKTFGLKGEPTLADKLVQQGIEYAPDIYGGASLFSSLINKIPAALKGAKHLKLSNLKNALEESGIAAEEAKEALKGAETAAVHKFGKSNPEALQYSLNQAKAKSSDLESILSNPVSQGENISFLPNAKFEEMTPYAAKHLKNASEKLGGIESEMGEHFYKGYEQGVPIAEEVVKQVKKVKDNIGSEYDQIENVMRDKNIIIPRTEDLDSLEQQTRQLLEKSRHHFKDDAEFEKTLTKYMEQVKPKVIGRDIAPAADVLAHYRTLRDAAQKIRQKAFSPGTASNKDLQASLIKEADSIENNAQNLEALLESHDLGGEIKALKNANKRWREEVVPLYKNSTYQTFLHKGFAPSKDVIYNLRGKGSGQEIIRNIIKKDPNLIRYALGQRYSKKPGAIHEFDELSQEFINASPETQKLIKAHKAAQEEHARLSNIHEEAKSYDVNNQARRKTQMEYDKIQAKMKSLEEEIPDLRAKATAEKQTLEQKHKNMIAYEKAMDEHHKLRKLVKKFGGVALKVGKKLTKI